MPETSGPRVTGTDAERQLDDLTWRDLFGDEAGVISDMDGSAYKLTLPTTGDVVSVGSTTQASLAMVGGFRHRISAGDTQDVTLAAVSGSARTDVISLKLDLAGFTGAPGPVRLVVTQGTSTAIPVLDDSSPGVEHLPLWALTRQPGQNLSQASVKRLYPRITPSRSIAPDSPLPGSSPLGTIVRQDDVEYRRVLDAASVPSWKKYSRSGINGGTTGAMAGAVPTVGAELITKTWSGTLALNAFGDNTITFPGGAFPNGVLYINANPNQGTAAPGFAFLLQTWGVTLSKTNIRGFLVSNGAVAANTSVATTLMAVGW